MRWRIYYGDWKTFSDRDGEPWDAPCVNVQSVAKENVRGSPPVKVKDGKDAFYWDKEMGWMGCDTLGLWDYLMLYKGPKAVLFGRTLHDDIFDRIRRRALSEGVG